MAPRRSLRISAATQKPAEEAAETEKILRGRTQGSRVAKARLKKTPVTATSSRTRARKRTATKLSSDCRSQDHGPPSTPHKRERESNQQNQSKPTLLSTPPPFIPNLKPNSTPSAPPDVNRPVDPHHTAATLITPHGTHLTAYARTTEEDSPSKISVSRPTTTTGNILEQGLAHLLKIDPKLRAVIDKYPSPPFSASHLAEKVDPFQSLASGIIGQQVSGLAAKSIKKKFVALFNKGPIARSSSDADGGGGGTVKEANGESDKACVKEKNDYDYGTNTDKSINENDNNDDADIPMRFPTPEEVVKCDLMTLRTAGLSQRKAEYIRGLAEKFVNGDLSARMLLTASDEDIFEKLIAVRGLGKWSVEMFSVFGLKRLDVFSTGDLGVQRGMAAYVGRDIAKLKAKKGDRSFKYMSEKEMLEIAAPFTPYKSLFMWYMWRWEDVDVTVMQD
ncbi:3-methyladenine DNA glycosylase [Emydomyces testavorans]|uniref:3-methyladenine DNA glycosylase n=1 Tax=Emydomyces testavorans TaxID=2070801 RepID=A0AAF0IGB2_9EURO|nr:3-methyladenine DNA glycosylase [Emydomyces testavorans]